MEPGTRDALRIFAAIGIGVAVVAIARSASAAPSRLPTSTAPAPAPTPTTPPPAPVAPIIAKFRFRATETNWGRTIAEQTAFDMNIRAAVSRTYLNLAGVPVGRWDGAPVIGLPGIGAAGSFSAVTTFAASFVVTAATTAEAAQYAANTIAQRLKGNLSNIAGFGGSGGSFVRAVNWSDVTVQAV